MLGREAGNVINVTLIATKSFTYLREREREITFVYFVLVRAES